MDPEQRGVADGCLLIPAVGLGFPASDNRLAFGHHWQRLSDMLEFVLGAGGPAYWQEPTDPQRLRLFCRMLDALRSQIEDEGLEP